MLARLLKTDVYLKLQAVSLPAVFLQLGVDLTHKDRLLQAHVRVGGAVVSVVKLFWT